MTIQTSSAVLKAYFETGDVPTAAQFGDLIDSTAVYDGTLENIIFSGSSTGSFGQIRAKELHPYTGSTTINVSASLLPPYTPAGSGSNLGSEMKPWKTLYAISASVDHLSRHTGSGAINVSGGLNPSVTSGDGVGFDLGAPSAKWRELHVSGASIDFLSSSLIPDQTNLRNLGSSDRQFNVLYAKSASLGNISGSTRILTASIDYLSSSLIPGKDDTYDLGSSGKEWKDLYVDGTAYIDTLALGNIAEQTIGTASIGVVSSSRIDGIGGYGNIIISGGLVPGTTSTFDLGTTTKQWQMLHISGVNIGSVSSSLIPDQDNTRDLGSSGKEWKDLYVDGTANIDTLSVDTGSFGRIGSNLSPTADNTYIIGSSSFYFKEASAYSASISHLAKLTGSSAITISGGLAPSVTDVFDLGTSALQFRSASIRHITASTLVVDTITANTTNYTATNTITGSNQFGSGSTNTNSFSGSISAVTDITASGNISASGTITAATFDFSNSTILTNQLTVTTSVWVSGSGQNVYLTNDGTISASSTISSSGTILGANLVSKGHITASSNISASGTISSTGIIYSAGMITSSVGFSTIGGHLSASDGSGSVQIISGGIYHQRIEGTSADDSDYTVHGRRFTVKNKLQAALPASESSAPFQVNNYSVQDGDVVLGSFMGLTEGGGTLGLSASIHCFTTASVSRGFLFYIHNNNTTTIADDSEFTASFVVL